MGDGTGGVTIGDCGAPRVTVVFASDGNGRDEVSGRSGGISAPAPVGAGIGGISSGVPVFLVAARGSIGGGSPTVSDSLRNMPLGTLQLSILSVLMIAWTTSQAVQPHTTRNLPG